MSLSNNTKLPIGDRIDGRWEIVKKLGQGSFGTVYAVNDTTGKVIGMKALKLESVAQRDQILKVEVAVLTDLRDTDHVCQIYASGKNERFNFMVMTLLGPSIRNLRKEARDSTFSKSTTMKVTLQCVKALRDMHDAGWLHRDVKPSNFAIGLHTYSEDRRRTIHILDFGLSKRFRSRDGKMKPPRELVGFRGSLRYCSLNAHKCKDLGRHDDLISLLYMMLEMLIPCLPWQDTASIEEVQNIKECFPSLLHAVSPIFDKVYNHLDQLQYAGTPDYDMFNDAINCVLFSLMNTLDYVFDWDCQDESTSRTSSKSKSKKRKRKSKKVRRP